MIFSKRVGVGVGGVIFQFFVGTQIWRIWVYKVYPKILVDVFFVYYFPFIGNPLFVNYMSFVKIRNINNTCEMNVMNIQLLSLSYPSWTSLFVPF